MVGLGKTDGIVLGEAGRETLGDAEGKCKLVGLADGASDGEFFTLVGSTEGLLDG